MARCSVGLHGLVQAPQPTAHRCDFRAHPGQYHLPDPISLESFSALALAERREGSWCQPME
jgi:hypothetical protein